VLLLKILSVISSQTLMAQGLQTSEKLLKDLKDLKRLFLIKRLRTNDNLVKSWRFLVLSGLTVKSTKYA